MQIKTKHGKVVFGHKNTSCGPTPVKIYNLMGGTYLVRGNWL